MFNGRLVFVLLFLTAHTRMAVIRLIFDAYPHIGKRLRHQRAEIKDQYGCDNFHRSNVPTKTKKRNDLRHCLHQTIFSFLPESKLR